MELPRTWKRLFSRISVIGQQFDHPLHLQAVNRRLFNQLLTNKLLCETSATNSTSLCDAALTLSNEEENAIRYACGYVCMKVLKTLRSSKKLTPYNLLSACLIWLAMVTSLLIISTPCTGRA